MKRKSADSDSEELEPSHKRRKMEEEKKEINDENDKNDGNDDYSKLHFECPEFKNKVILAPMVRVGTFPMRLLALQYGADLVYNQELIDHKVIRFIRKKNIKHKCIDFYDKSNDKLVFRTFPTEKVIFQIGSCDAIRCLNACKIIQNDVLGIDLNMGCPKKFSILGGMGAALLTKPDIVEDIVKTLKRNLRNNLSITCKIRLLKDEKDSIELCQRLEKLNINALGIHARHIDDRPYKPARIDLIKPVVDKLSLPTIYNGDIYKYSDIETAKNKTGCDSVMIARGAQWNVSIFDKSQELQSLDKIVNEYTTISEKYGNVFQNSKYVVIKMICGRKWLCKSPVITQFQKVKNWNDMYDGIKSLGKALNERQATHKDDGIDNIYTDPSVFTDL